MNYGTYIAILTDIAGKPFDYPTEIKARELIVTARAALIRQQYQKTGTFPTSAKIKICFDMEIKSSSECCGVDLGCKIAVTKQQIPMPMDVKDAIDFEFVGDIMGINAYGYLKPGEIPFIKERKFSSKLLYYTVLNRKIIVINNPAIEKISARYVPSNFIEAMQFGSCDGGGSCINWEDNAFIEDHWEDAITKMVLPKLVPQPARQIDVDENGTN
jgi:hypothetical protein